MVPTCSEHPACVRTRAVDDAAGGSGTISVFLADDNLIVREGVKALIERHKDLRIVGVAADYDEVVDGATDPAAAGPGHRHPDAAGVQPRGHRRRQGGAQAASGDRRRDPLPVRRPRVRRVPPGRGLGRLRVPLEGPHRAGRSAGRRDPVRGHRRERARSGHRRRAAAPDDGERRSLASRGGAPRDGGGGQADQGHRRRQAPPARSGRCRSRGRVRQAGRGRLGRHRGGAAAAAAAAQGDRRPRGAGRDAVAAPSRRAGREAPS